MLTAEMNARVTQVGPGTACGKLLRQYWQPIALSEELEGTRPLKPVRLFGENLVLFRDEAQQLGLIDRHCCHRGADLAFGRLEDGGIRCPFHGWLYDVGGACLEQPAEPASSTFYRKVRQTAYPVRECNGMIFAYLGAGAAPALPKIDAIAAPAAYSFAFKGLIEANWLQALEVGIDPAHASYLHRFFEDEDEENYGQQFGAKAADTDIPVTKVLRNYATPEIDVEEAPYGLRIFARRELNDRDSHLRVTNLVFPNAFMIPMSNDMTITQWHVPVDDESNYWYAMFTDYRQPVDQQTMRDQRLQSCTLPDYRSLKNRENDWGYDEAEQRSKTYTGMGRDINVHDQWAVESPGPIQDRSKEHLGSTDKAIIANRKLLTRSMDLVEEGNAAPFNTDANGEGWEDLLAIDTIVPSASWRSAWRDHEAKRRGASPWAAPQQAAE